MNREAMLARAEYLKKLTTGEYSLESAPCLCGSKGGILIARVDRYALPIDTWLCTSCGLMRTSPRLDRTSLKMFYEQDYRAIYVGSVVASGSFFDDQVYRGRQVLSFIGGINKCRGLVFDVGCGAGGTLVPFREAGYSVRGCDIGPDYLEYGRRRGLDLYSGSVDSIPMGEPADVVILSHVLEHEPDPRGMLAEVRSRLAEGGLLYIEVPGILSIHRTYGDILKFLQNAHLYHFTLATLREFVSSCGFTFVKGNERVCSVFRKSSIQHVTDARNPAEAHRILKYLDRMERMPVRVILPRLHWALRTAGKIRRAAIKARSRQ